MLSPRTHVEPAHISLIESRRNRTPHQNAKISPRRQAGVIDEIRQGARIEIWFQDEARVGQKNEITRGWAKRGTRPRAPHDQRTRSAYIFGAICPKDGKGAGRLCQINSARNS